MITAEFCYSNISLKLFCFFPVITDNSDTDSCTTSSFVLPPSNYQVQNLNKSISAVNANATHVSIQESIHMENNMSSNYI